MAKNWKGCRFNKLVMIAPIGGGGSGKGMVWACVCDCGNGCEKVGKDVAAGRIRSCGKCRTALGNPGPRVNPETTLLRKRFATAVRRATRENMKWDLTPSQYKGIVDKPCSFCGSGPDRYMQVATFDHVQGYTLAVTRCYCSECRALIGQRNPVDFLRQIDKILTHIKFT